MPRRAQLPDGRILEFPDETTDEVMDATVKRELSVAPAQPTIAEQVGSKIPAPVSELAGAINRGVTEGLDVLPRGINEAGRRLGFDTDLPTFSEGLEAATGGTRNFMEPGIARDVVQATGEAVPAVAGLVAGTRKAALDAKDLAENVLHQAPKQAVAAKSKAADSALKQGFDSKVVDEIRLSSPQTKARMKRMVGMFQSGRGRSRPGDVLGDSVARRINRIAVVNRRAGKQLDTEAQKLAGKDVDLTSAFHQFTESLSKHGVSFGDDGKLVFDNSTFDGTQSSENLLKLLSRRLQKVGDAQDAHRLKRFIDDKVDFGDGGEGVSGATEGVAKALRRAIDQALDAKFDRYREINDTFSETVSALNQFQDVAGKRLDLTGANVDKAIGALSRRLLSNAPSRVPLIDALDQIDEVAGKYGANVSDDIQSLALFADELDRVFKPVAKTSLGGEFAKTAVTQGQAGLLEKGVTEGLKKARRINDEQAVKAIRGLLAE